MTDPIPPKASEAAVEIGRLASRILALAPTAGLYVRIKIDPATTSQEKHHGR